MSRPRFQFRLRTLFIVLTLLAIPCGYVGWQKKIVADRAAFLEGLAKPPGTVPILRSPRTSVSSVEPSKLGTVPFSEAVL
jgi:hypothetical protein